FQARETCTEYHDMLHRRDDNNAYVRSFDLFAQRSGQVLLGRKLRWRERERRDSKPRPQAREAHAHEDVNRVILLTPCLRGMSSAPLDARCGTRRTSSDDDAR